jgi:integrase
MSDTVQSLADRIRRLGRQMPRERLQRPEVKSWIGKSGEKFWKGEWRLYIEGRPNPKHRAQTWPQAKYTKSAAQKALDAIVQEETGGAAKPDGNLTVKQFWEGVFWPSHRRRVAPNTAINYESAWKSHVEPAIGKQELQHVTRSAVAAVLDTVVDAGNGESSVKMALTVMRVLFVTAQEDGYIARNPTAGATMPRCKPSEETRPLTIEECAHLLETMTGRDRLIWHILLMTGARINEVCALRRSDLIPVGLQIDESSFRGRGAQTKTRKIRYAPIPADLRREIEAWDSGHPDLLFPRTEDPDLMLGRKGLHTMLLRSRKVSGIADLTFRQARTTFATHFAGDVRDAQAILGHSSVNMTLGVYRKPQAARMQAAVDELAALLKRKVVQMPAPKKEQAG